MPPRRSGRVLWRGHAGTRACGKASLSTSAEVQIACSGEELAKRALRRSSGRVHAMGGYWSGYRRVVSDAWRFV